MNKKEKFIIKSKTTDTNDTNVNEDKIKESGEKVKLNTEFGYSRKDVILIGLGLIALGYGISYALQAFGVNELRAGIFAQLVIFMVVLMNWIATYIFRVANKVLNISIYKKRKHLLNKIENDICKTIGRL